MKRLRPKLTYADVISTLCLFLLVAGGTAFAAAEILPKGSVGTKQLKNGAVTGKKVKAGSLTASDFAPKQLPEGARGPAGPAGAKGATGVQGPQGVPGSSGNSAAVSIEHVTANSAIDTTTEKEVQVTCPSGKVLGGGYVLNAEARPAETLRAVRSYAVSEETWLVRAINSGAAEIWELAVIAVCTK
jgi:hypothetical protein